VDWSKPNCQLADEMGRSGERIRQIRQELDAPSAAHPRRRRRSVAALQWAKDNLDKLKGMTGRELGRKYGLSPRWQYGPLYQFLKPFLRDGQFLPKHRWDLMNFRLPSADLDRIWKLPCHMAASHRYRKQSPPPVWSFQGGHPRFSGRAQLQAYQRAVKAEERNAARYFARLTEGREAPMADDEGEQGRLNTEP
jgi:hypothetical protein